MHTCAQQDRTSRVGMIEPQIGKNDKKILFARIYVPRYISKILKYNILIRNPADPL